MKLLLNENIRIYRKKMSLTQEQLAEAMGVSVATVSKWENGSISPDVEMLAELADFFQISVDVLLGYQWKKRGAEQCVEYIRKLCNERRFDEALMEVNKILQKYPNHFKVLYECGEALFIVALNAFRDEQGKPENRRAEELERAVKLFEKALDLYDQNTDKNISRESIHQNIGNIYAYTGDFKKAVDYLEEHNVCHINDKMLGMLLCDVGEFDRAWVYLSKTLRKSLLDLWSNHMGVWAVLMLGKQNYEAALQTSLWMKNLCVSVMAEDSSYFLRAAAVSDAMIVTVYAYKEMTEKRDYTQELKHYMKEALEEAVRFDANPDFTGKLRFFEYEVEHLHDSFGDNAVIAVKYVIQCFREEEKVYDRLASIYNDIAKGLELNDFLR